MRLSITCLLLIACLASVFAQDPLASKMSWYERSKPSSSLFVHFDKQVYANNETVWFTAYLMYPNTETINKHEVLAVSLVRAIDSLVILQHKFLFQDQLAFGQLTLPDSLITGDYILMAHTNLVIAGKPAALFVQPISIKTNIDPKFKASIKLMAPATTNNTNQVMLNVTSKDGRFLPKPVQVSYTYGNNRQHTKTDVSGQLLLSLPQQPDLVDPNIYVKLSYEKDSSTIQMPLPQPKSKARVRFYPEGGHMVLGLANTVAWEARDQQNKPMALKALLYKNGTPIDTVETNSYGTGKFKLIPESNAQYTVKLTHSALIDSTYQLPIPIEKGLTMQVAMAIANDTLSVTLHTTSPQKLFLRMHNFRESYVYVPFDMVYRKQMLKIPLTAVPKGLATLTISDSLDRPLAERMFFAHYSNQPLIKLNTNKGSYQPREKVSLKLSLTDVDEQAIVSIACVQDNRITQKNNTDIESYTYLTKELGVLPVHLFGRPMADRSYLEQTLLVKGWRKYNWQELQQLRAADTLVNMDSLKISGQVNRSNKTLTKPVDIAVMSNNSLGMVATTPNGYFDLSTSNLLSETGKELFLFVNEQQKAAYTLKINDPYAKMATDLAHTLHQNYGIIPSTLVNNMDLVVSNNEKTIQLDAVTITAKQDNSFNYRMGPPGRNACGDYVCRFNILNCKNHINDSGNTAPVVGRLYQVDGFKKPYDECKVALNEDRTFIVPFDPIHLAKTFYVDDYKDPQEPALFSTIYWNHATLLKAKNETEISFYTGDIVGKFRIVVQGVSKTDVAYAEYFFEVKK